MSVTKGRCTNHNERTNQRVSKRTMKNSEKFHFLSIFVSCPSSPFAGVCGAGSANIKAGNKNYFAGDCLWQKKRKIERHFFPSRMSRGDVQHCDIGHSYSDNLLFAVILWENISDDVMACGWIKSFIFSMLRKKLYIYIFFHLIAAFCVRFCQDDSDTMEPEHWMTQF